MSSRAALVFTLTIAGHAAAAAGTCARRAQLTGDREAVARVVVELGKLGVATDGAPDAGCRSVHAVVELDPGGQLAVAVSDASHHSEGRVVDDPAVAAAWIDSWLYDDLEAWTSQAPGATITVPSPSPSPSASATAIATAIATHPSRLSQVSFSAGFEETWSSDGTSWQGIGAAACFPVDGVCLGARFRYARQSLAANLAAATRDDISILATAATTLHVGTMLVTPELGLGIGRVTTTRVESCPPMVPVNCDPTDPACMMPPAPTCTGDPTTGPDANGNIYVGDNLHVESYAPRASAVLRIAVPLFRRVWLDGTAAATATPFAHGDPYPATRMVPNVAPDQIAIPGEASYAVILGVGLRLEMP